MSARSELPAILQDHGWMQLGNSDTTRIVYFKWSGNRTREEVTICFDRAGRVKAWSIWLNQRASLDQEPGLRARLTEYVVES